MHGKFRKNANLANENVTFKILAGLLYRQCL